MSYKGTYRDWIQLKVDECVFFRDNVIFVVYVDDGIFASPSQKAIDQAIKELKEQFDMEDQGSITDYLGVNIEHLSNRDIKLSQPILLIKSLTKYTFQSKLQVNKHQRQQPKF
jgi:hypothetical protein